MLICVTKQMGYFCGVRNSNAVGVMVDFYVRAYAALDFSWESVGETPIEHLVDTIRFLFSNKIQLL